MSYCVGVASAGPDIEVTIATPTKSDCSALTALFASFMLFSPDYQGPPARNLRATMPNYLKESKLS